MFTLVHITFLYPTSTALPGAFAEPQKSWVFYQREAASRKRHRVICSEPRTEEGEYFLFFLFSFFRWGVEVWGNHQEFHMQPFFCIRASLGPRRWTEHWTSLPEPKHCGKDNLFLFKNSSWSFPKNKKMIHFALIHCDAVMVHLSLTLLYLVSKGEEWAFYAFKTTRVKANS